MNVSICSADFNVTFNGMKCKVYAIKNTIHYGGIQHIDFLLYLRDEWIWIYANQCEPLSREEANK